MSYEKNGQALPPAYALERSSVPPKGTHVLSPASTASSYTTGEESLDYSTGALSTTDHEKSENEDNDSGTLYTNQADDDTMTNTSSYIQQKQTAVGEATSSITANPSYSYNDATKVVHEMHLALLYLLSNPEEFQKALKTAPPRGTTTLADWHTEYDYGTDVGTATDYDYDNLTYSTVGDATAETDTTKNTKTDHHTTSSPSTVATQKETTPLPYVVFADDAEVVLPQAHTASQLFGIERYEGIELEAAAGISALSQLFLRWLALMPGGDHLNIIDPPGLTVMRIAGGRYRVTAAHRVVWTWMNQFCLPDDPDAEEKKDDKNNSKNSSNNNSKDEKGVDDEEENQGADKLQVGDLVTMTIVDVFETDNNGKLLSYCPTFDNRAIMKTNHHAESIKKASNQFMNQLTIAKNSKTAKIVNKKLSVLTKLSMKAVSSLKVKIDEQVHKAVNTNSPTRNNTNKEDAATTIDDVKGFEQALNEVSGENDQNPPMTPPRSSTNTRQASATTIPTSNATPTKSKNEFYISDDDTHATGAMEV